MSGRPKRQRAFALSRSWEMLYPVEAPRLVVLPPEIDVGHKMHASQGRIAPKKMPRRVVPNEDSRTIVANMASYGFGLVQITQMTGISASALYKHYGKELKTATIAKDLDVLQAAYLQAVGGPERNWRLARWPATQGYLQARGLWKPPTQRYENVGEGPDFSRFTDKQLEDYERLLLAAAPPGSEQFLLEESDPGSEGGDGETS